MSVPTPKTGEKDTRVRVYPCYRYIQLTDKEARANALPRGNSNVLLGLQHM